VVVGWFFLLFWAFFFLGFQGKYYFFWAFFVESISAMLNKLLDTLFLFCVFRVVLLRSFVVSFLELG
jgi:hypothetical protein